MCFNVLASRASFVCDESLCCIMRSHVERTEMKMKLENSEPLSLPLCWLTSMLEQEGDVDAEIEAFKIKLQMSQVSIVR